MNFRFKIYYENISKIFHCRQSRIVKAIFNDRDFFKTRRNPNTAVGKHAGNTSPFRN